MRHRIGVHVWAAIAAVLALSLAADACAARGGSKGRARAARRAQTFTLSADYTGYLGGTMVIHGVTYSVAPDAPVYVLGEGLVAQGQAVANRSVFLAGERTGSVSLVRAIIVRPAASEAEGAGTGGGGVGAVDDSSAPR